MKNPEYWRDKWWNTPLTNEEEGRSAFLKLVEEIQQDVRTPTYPMKETPTGDMVKIWFITLAITIGVLIVVHYIT